MAHSFQWSHQLPKGLFLLSLHMGGSGTIHNPSYCIQYIQQYHNFLWELGWINIDDVRRGISVLGSNSHCICHDAWAKVTNAKVVLLIEEATLLDSMSVWGRLWRCLRCGRFNGYNKSSTLSCQARCPMNMLPGTDYMTLLLSSSIVCYGHYTL